MAIATLITGIGSWCIGLLAPVALILAYLEWNNIKDGTSSPKGKPFVIIGGIFGGLAMLLICGFAAFYMLIFGGVMMA